MSAHTHTHTQWSSHQTVVLEPNTHCPVCLCARVRARAGLLPISSLFVWVSVSGVVCRQASIVFNHCSLLTQGPRRFMFPWPPSHSGWKAETRAPDLGRVCLHSPFSLPWCSSSLCPQGWMAAPCECVCCAHVCVCRRSLFDITIKTDNHMVTAAGGTTHCVAVCVCR